jgi:hypothetical protein
METARARGEESRNQEAANCTQDKAGMRRYLLDGNTRLLGVTR